MNHFTDTDHNLFEIIKYALWGTGAVVTDTAVYEELKQHALISLPAGILSSVSIPDDLRDNWQLEVYQQILYNVNYRYEQARLPISIPYVILKGTTAAKYYLHPEYRVMGDIDIMTSRDDYPAACEMLLQNGFREITSDIAKGSGRHRQFMKNGIEVEVHAYYAYMNDPKKAKLLDDMIIDNINPSHELPDEINGLVLIEHINHHIEEGLGLRQIIDWMMYVDKCLPDERWPSFQALVRKTGHETLVIVTTRMCELYLGLSEHNFCAQVDVDTCEEFMNYVLTCGNFGRKQEEGALISKGFFGSAHTVKGAFQFLQGRGLITWKAAQKYRCLRPFAWMYQAFRYFKKGLHRKDNLTKLKAEYEMAQKRNRLLVSLGVTKEENGIVRYRDGKYIIN